MLPVTVLQIMPPAEYPAFHCYLMKTLSFTMNGFYRQACGLLLLALPLTCAAEPTPGYSKRFPAKWLERDGRIQLGTLCYNYPESSYMYHLCRQEAANTLQARCQRYQAVLQRDPDAIHYRELADKYCHAARNYHPFPQQESPDNNNGQ